MTPYSTSFLIGCLHLPYTLLQNKSHLPIQHNIYDLRHSDILYSRLQSRLKSPRQSYTITHQSWHRHDKHLTNTKAAAEMVTKVKDRLGKALYTLKPSLSLPPFALPPPLRHWSLHDQHFCLIFRPRELTVSTLADQFNVECVSSWEAESCIDYNNQYLSLLPMQNHPANKASSILLCPCPHFLNRT